MEQVKIKDLKYYENNVRKHPESQLEKLENSIRDFGFINPLIIDENNVILVGNGRSKAAERAGLVELPCIRVTNLTEEQKRAYALVENKLTELGEWDYDIMNQELEALGIDMSRYGFEVFGQMEIIDEGELREAENTNSEIDLGSFDNEQFEYECPDCGFRFNRWSI